MAGDSLGRAPAIQVGRVGVEDRCLVTTQRAEQKFVDDVTAEFAEALAVLCTFGFGEDKKPKRSGGPEEVRIETSARQPRRENLPDLDRRVLQTGNPPCGVTFHLFAGREPDRPGQVGSRFRRPQDVAARQITL